MSEENKDEGADKARAYYGVLVVGGGLIAILVAFVVAVVNYSEAADVSTAMAPITGVIGAVVGAYFGVQVGSEGKEKAEEARTKAEDEVKVLAASASPEEAMRALSFKR